MRATFEPLEDRLVCAAPLDLERSPWRALESACRLGIAFSARSVMRGTRHIVSRPAAFGLSQGPEVSVVPLAPSGLLLQMWESFCRQEIAFSSRSAERESLDIAWTRVTSGLVISPPVSS